MIERAFTDYYAVLDIKQDASLSDIKRAYHEKAFLCHPDMAGEAGAGVFMLVQKAYETLAGVGRRAYDMELISRRNLEEGASARHDMRFVSERISKRRWWEDPLKSRGVDALMKAGGKRS